MNNNMYVMINDRVIRAGDGECEYVISREKYGDEIFEVWFDRLNDMTKQENVLISDIINEIKHAIDTLEEDDAEVPTNSLQETINETLNSMDLPEGFSTSEGELFYKDLSLSKTFGRRIVLTYDTDDHRIFKFLQKLAEVDSRDVFESICDFLEVNSDIMIDPDGDLLFWKHIDSKFRALHANLDGSRNLHTRGVPIRMQRANVERNKNVTCSKGLHVCAKSYLSSYSGDIAALCKVDVRNIVSIPTDYNNAKIRCCEYTPIEFYNSDGNIVQRCADIETKYNGVSKDEIEHFGEKLKLSDNTVISNVREYLRSHDGIASIHQLQKLKRFSQYTSAEIYTKLKSSGRFVLMGNGLCSAFSTFTVKEKR